MGIQTRAVVCQCKGTQGVANRCW